jgi:hypothetical protein
MFNKILINNSKQVTLSASSSPQNAVEVDKDTHPLSEFAVCEFAVGVLSAVKLKESAVGIFCGWGITAVLEQRITGRWVVVGGRW